MAGCIDNNFHLNAVLRRRRDRRKRGKHRFWVRAIYQRREQLGLYKTLVQELKHEDRESYIFLYTISTMRHVIFFYYGNFAWEIHENIHS